VAVRARARKLGNSSSRGDAVFCSLHSLSYAARAKVCCAAKWCCSVEDGSFSGKHSDSVSFGNVA
jgi:hypothetical protein